MKRKDLAFMDLLAVVVVLGLIALIITPIIIGVIDRQNGKTRTRLANEVMEAARYFYTSSMEDDKIDYPTDGLEFVCNKKDCEATIAMTTKEAGIAILKEEKPVTYQLIFKGQAPSSGSIVIEKDGTIFPKNLAMDSHLCVYNEDRRVFTSC